MSIVNRFGYNFKERNLLYYSDYVMREEPLLHKFLKHYKNMNKVIFESEAFLNAFYDVSLFPDIIPYLDRRTNTLSYMVDKIKNEWVCKCDDFKETTLDSEKFICELCGNTELKTCFLIYNARTDTRLYVGSSCIQDYNISSEYRDGDRTVTEERLNTHRIKASKNRALLNSSSGFAIDELQELVSQWSKLEFWPSVDIANQFLTLKESGEALITEVTKVNFKPDRMNAICNELSSVVKEAGQYLAMALDLANKDPEDWVVTNAIYQDAVNIKDLELAESLRLHGITNHNIAKIKNREMRGKLIDHINNYPYREYEFLLARRKGEFREGVIILTVFVDDYIINYPVNEDTLLADLAEQGYPDKLRPLQQLEIKRFLLSRNQLIDYESREQLSIYDVVMDLIDSSSLGLKKYEPHMGTILVSAGKRGAEVSFNFLNTYISRYILNSFAPDDKIKAVNVIRKKFENENENIDFFDSDNFKPSRF